MDTPLVMSVGEVERGTSADHAPPLSIFQWNVFGLTKSDTISTTTSTSTVPVYVPPGEEGASAKGEGV